MASRYKTCPPALPRLSSSERWLKIDCLQITQYYFSHQKQFWKLFLSGWNPVSKLEDKKRFKTICWTLTEYYRLQKMRYPSMSTHGTPQYPVQGLLIIVFCFACSLWIYITSAFDLFFFFFKMHLLNWRGKAFCSLFMTSASYLQKLLIWMVYRFCLSHIIVLLRTGKTFIKNTYFSVIKQFWSKRWLIHLFHH